MRRQFAEARPVWKKTNEVHFINTKVFEGRKYTGSRKESFKTWSKKVKIFLNSQHGGMRQALETSEEASAQIEVRDLQLPS